MKKKQAFEKWGGVIPAITTPFQHHAIDQQAFCAHLTNLSRTGVAGIVVAGTTGEALALTIEEKVWLIRAAKKHFQTGPLIAGITACHSAEAHHQIGHFSDAGADALLILPPYYVKADHKGMQAFFENLLSITDLPCILYNNPSRTGFEMDLAMIHNLSLHPQIIGLKEASPHLGRVQHLRHHCPDLLLWSGDDSTCPGFLALGGDGVISVGAVAYPQLYTDLIAAWTNSNVAAFASAVNQLSPLHLALEKKSSPSIIKHIMYLKGIGDGTMRLPLGPLTETEKGQVKNLVNKLDSTL